MQRRQRRVTFGLAVAVAAAAHAATARQGDPHRSRGCGQANLEATGGAGLFYCFAAN